MQNRNFGPYLTIINRILVDRWALAQAVKRRRLVPCTSFSMRTLTRVYGQFRAAALSAQRSCLVSVWMLYFFPAHSSVDFDPELLRCSAVALAFVNVHCGQRSLCPPPPSADPLVLDPELLHDGHLPRGPGLYDPDAHAAQGLCQVHQGVTPATSPSLRRYGCTWS
jgi:hypothetical protein